MNCDALIYFALDSSTWTTVLRVKKHELCLSFDIYLDENRRIFDWSEKKETRPILGIYAIIQSTFIRKTFLGKKPND